MLEAVQFLKIIVTAEPNFVLSRIAQSLIIQTFDYTLSQNSEQCLLPFDFTLGIKSKAFLFADQGASIYYSISNTLIKVSKRHTVFGPFGP